MLLIKLTKKGIPADALSHIKIKSNQYSQRLCSKSNISFLMRSDS